MRALERVRFCSYCGSDGDREHGPDGKPWTIDHVIPKDKGGSDNPHNLVKACHRCNCKKHTKIGGEWTPRLDAITAAGIPWMGVHAGCFPENNQNKDATWATGDDAYEEYISELENRLHEATTHIRKLERAIWEMRHAIRNIEIVATNAYGSVEITYNPSERGYK